MSLSNLNQKAVNGKSRNNDCKKHAPLPLFEISLYWAVWIPLLSYAVYAVWIASYEYKDEIYGEFLEERWTFLGRKKDVTDFEWEFWTSALTLLLPAMLLHMFGGLIFSHFLPEFKGIYCLLFSLTFCVFSVGWKSLIFLLSHCCLVFGVCVIFKSVVMLWICCIGISFSLQINTIKEWQVDRLSTDPRIKNLTTFVALMSVLRCISFGMEYCWRARENLKDKQSSLYSLLDLLVFNFYLPVFVNGPVITFDTFQKTFYQPQRSFTREEITSIVKDTIRTIGWYIFLEGFLHFVYATAFTQEPRIFTSLSKWALCGVMYSMLQIFLLKYKVFYLGAGLFARMDGVAVPLPPRCVSTLYLFTDMWKYFDRGLHVWMIRYIYIPMGGSHKGIVRQLFASICTFAFIWQWHGGDVVTLWWFIPNWMGVVTESMASIVLAKPFVKGLEDKLSPAASRRMRAVFGVGTVSCLILSNLVFLCGTDPVWFYIKRMFFDGWPSSAGLLLFSMYLVVQTNMELNRHMSSW